MTRTQNIHNVATARGYAILAMIPGGSVAQCQRISPHHAPDHLAYALFRFNDDGSFHSCNYSSSANAMVAAFSREVGWAA